MSHDRIGPALIESSRPEPALSELVECVVNGQASAQQHAQLERQLLASEAARDFYLDYIQLHSALRRRFLMSDAIVAEQLDGPVTVLAESRAAAKSNNSHSNRQPSSRRWQLRDWALLAAASSALTLLVVLFVARPWASPHFTAETATLLEIEGSAAIISSAGEHPAQVGDLLRVGDTLRVGADSAWVEMKYPDGTLVRIGSDSVAHSPVNQEVRLQLLSGAIEVDAAKQPPNRPLVFATEHSRYVVLGTRFRLYREERATRLELDEGKVRMERPASGESIKVDAGSVAIAADALTPVEILPLSPGSAKQIGSLKNAGQHVCFAPDFAHIVTSDSHQGLKRWRLKDAKLLDEHRRNPGESQGLWVLGNGRTAIQANKNGYVLAWPIGEAEAIKLPLPGRNVRCRALSRDGATIAESGDSGTLIYKIDWSENKLKELLGITMPRKAWSLSLTPNGSRLAAGFWDGTVRVYEVPSGEILFDRKLLHTPTLLELSADGQQLLCFTQKDGLIWMNLESGEQKLLWPAGSSSIRSVHFTPDGRRAIAGLNDRTARMWAVEDGRQLLVIETGHAPRDVAWLEELQMLATADGTVKLWKCDFKPAILPASQTKGD